LGAFQIAHPAFRQNSVLQKKNGFWPHVKEQVDDAEVREETVFVAKNLIIGAGDELSVGQGMTGVDHVAEIILNGRLERCSEPDGGIQIEQAADHHPKDFVEIN